MTWLRAAVVSLAAAALVAGVLGVAPAGARTAAPTWARATAFPRPAFTPRRTIAVSTASGFWSAWNGIRPGDEIDVHGVTFTGETILTNKHLSGWAEVHFDRGTTFVGGDGNFPAVWIKSDSHVRFFGGTATSPHGGAGILIYDSSWLTWWDFVVHDTGSSGLMVQGITRPNDYLDLRGDISRWGLDLGLDPHAEKGTGLHGALLADAYYGVEHSRFALTLHDGATGAGVEAGGARPTDVFRDNTLYLRCSRLTMQAKVQVAGNCLELWGQNVTGNVVRYLSATSLQGRALDTNGMDPGQSLRSDVLDYARASRTNLNPFLARTESAIAPRQPWDPRFGIVLRNVAPR